MESKSREKEVPGDSPFGATAPAPANPDTSHAKAPSRTQEEIEIGRVSVLNRVNSLVEAE